MTVAAAIGLSEVNVETRFSSTCLQSQAFYFYRFLLRKVEKSTLNYVYLILQKYLQMRKFATMVKRQLHLRSILSVATSETDIKRILSLFYQEMRIAMCYRNLKFSIWRKQETIKKERLCQIHEKRGMKLHGEEFNLKVCANCDRFVIQDRSIMKVLVSEFIKVMKIRLRIRNNKLDSNLIAFYNISEQFLPLKSKLLSPNSEIKRQSETTSIRICYFCLEYL